MGPEKTRANRQAHAAGFTLVPKGKRKGIHMPWTAFVEDDAVLYSELHASIRRALAAKH